MRNYRSGSFFLKHAGIFWALTLYYFRIIPRDWYRKVPFLPIPPAAYVRWRLRTAYGKHRPPWTEVLGDLWQFGDWLRTFQKN
jgi:hypothetical protein